MSDKKRFETMWGGRPLSIETGVYAMQANGSCLVQYGDTVVLATATMGETAREGTDFFPLTVDFEEKLYAAGRIKGSRFIKKEGRPTDEAVLTSRFIDRAIRPLFDQSLRIDVQVIVTCLAFDGENDPDIVGLIAASCALHISDIPWNGPIADIRIGKIPAGEGSVSGENGEWVINPSYEARKKSLLDLAFAGTTEKIIMVEAAAMEVPEETVLNAFWFGQSHLDRPIGLIEEAQKAVGKTKRIPGGTPTPEQEARAMRKQEVGALARPFIIAEINSLFFDAPKATKGERRAAKTELKRRLKTFLLEQGVQEGELSFGTAIMDTVLDEEIARAVLEDNRRVDGRGITEIRPLFSEVAVLPRVHGSAHFKRGETQVLSIVTLGAPGDEQTLDGMEYVGTKRYIHHYNFPPFSVGEVKPLRGPSRRDIGHGALAEKALEVMIPDKESFPYTIRVVSEVLGSNGSSSMGATCGSTLALMDAGVPIKSPIAGVAMGLASNEKGDWKVMTDLQDLEDGTGGMDFKIAGSKTGIVAIQMDTKTAGLTREIIEQTLHQAKTGRLAILENMLATLAEPRPDLSPYAPRIISLRINPKKIGDVIGPGGKMINEIIDTTGVQAIDIEDDGLVMITSMNPEGAKKAEEWIRNLTREAAVGEIFPGKVTRLMDFGAFVEYLPKQEGLVHVSMLAPWRVQKVADIVKVGDVVQVKVVAIDDLGRINLSMKDAPGNTYPPQPTDSGQPSGDLRKPTTFRKSSSS